VASGLVVIGLLVLVASHMIGDGNGAAPLAHRKGSELQPHPNQSAVLPTPLAGQVDAGVGTPSQGARRHHHTARREHDRRAERGHRKRVRPKADRAKASSAAVPEPQSESAPPPEPEPEVTPAPRPESAPPPEPQVTAAPEPESAPEPTSSPESKTNEPSQVEAEFGFQK
jgi:hypothetical protein